MVEVRDKVGILKVDERVRLVVGQAMVAECVGTFVACEHNLVAAMAMHLAIMFLPSPAPRL